MHFEKVIQKTLNKLNIYLNNYDMLILKFVSKRITKNSIVNPKKTRQLSNFKSFEFLKVKKNFRRVISRFNPEKFPSLSVKLVMKISLCLIDTIFQNFFRM